MEKCMPKLSTVIAASAVLIALSAPSFAADVDTSTSHHSTITRDRDDARSATPIERKDDSMIKNRGTIGRDQSAQLPERDTDRDRDNDRDRRLIPNHASPLENGSGRSANAPGHEMQEHGSVPGHPGASGYAPGHQ
jgi:hypothetical protein